MKIYNIIVGDLQQQHTYGRYTGISAALTGCVCARCHGERDISINTEGDAKLTQEEMAFPSQIISICTTMAITGCDDCPHTSRCAVYLYGNAPLCSMCDRYQYIERYRPGAWDEPAVGGDV